jgi:hypothetical protein
VIPASVWARNAIVGAAITSLNAVLITANQLSQGASSTFAHSRGALFTTLVVAGALAGTVFTALQPVRRRSELGRYVGWILSAYVVLAVGVLAGAISGDDNAKGIVTTPFGLLLLVVGGALSGIIACRVIEE